MIKKEPVNINWQSLFVFVPLVDLWAAYRIEKLRRYSLIIWVPSMFAYYFVRSLIYVSYFEQEDLLEGSNCGSSWAFYYFFDTCDQIEIQMIDIVLVASFIGLAIFLIRKWSKEWNEKQTSQSSNLPI